MADETNLSSKLPVADRTSSKLPVADRRGERSKEESSVGDALALAFRCACFCSTSLIRFASYSPASPFMRPCHFAQFCAIFSHDCWYAEVFKSGFEGVLVSLLLTTMGGFPDL